MSKEKQEEKLKKRRITFSLEAPEAREVILLGDFNNWDAKAHPMKRNQEGVWKKIVMLAPERYEYRFLVDGHWCNDPQNDLSCPNCFGSQNNIILVSPKK